MKQEKSCGAVVYRLEKGEPRFLLIRHVNGGHWAFPKGHVEKDETETETALREIREETGLAVALQTDFRQAVSYSPKPGVTQDVVYFLARAAQDAVTRQQEEVSDSRWLPEAEALELVTYPNDRVILQAAANHLKG